MKLTYYGHSAFLAEATDGTKVILDPYRAESFDGALRYGPITDTADAAVASHTHDDHGGVDTLPGHPQTFVHPSKATVGGWQISGVHVSHDAEGGRSRGKNTIIILDDGDLRLVHLGDLGHTLDRATVEAIGRVDVLLVPVGGFFTIDHKQAAQVVDSLSPRIVIPMHYKTAKTDFPISGVDAFLATQPSVEHVSGSTLEVSRETLPPTRMTYVLQPAR